MVLLDFLVELYDLNISFEYLLALQVLLDFSHLNRPVRSDDGKSSVDEEDPEQGVAPHHHVTVRSHNDVVDLREFIYEDDATLRHHEATLVLDELDADAIKTNRWLASALAVLLTLLLLSSSLLSSFSLAPCCFFACLLFNSGFCFQPSRPFLRCFQYLLQVWVPLNDLLSALLGNA